MSDVEESVTVRADPQVLYDMVSDLTRMGEWSPENTGGRWVGGAAGPEVGARFHGSNRHRLLRWSTVSTVTQADPGRRFSWRVNYGPLPIAEWEYTFAPDGDGCRVTEGWTERRPLWMRAASAPVMGVFDRPAHNRANMRATLAALKTAAEATALREAAG